MQLVPALQATPTGAPTQPMSATPTSAPASTSGALSQMGAVTTVHLALIAVFALLAVIAIVYGVRQKAKRRAAEREERARLDSHGDNPLGEARTAMPSPVREAPRPPAEAGPAVDLPVPSPRHDPVPSREDRVAVVEAEPPVPLTRIKGLGPKVAARLAELGVTRVDQIAALSDDEADSLDAQLGAFRGRIARDRWVEQARFLAAGDTKGFEAVFGRL